MEMEHQSPHKMRCYLSTTFKGWLDTWLGVQDHLAYTINMPLPIPKDDESIAMQRWWVRKYMDVL